MSIIIIREFFNFKDDLANNNEEIFSSAAITNFLMDYEFDLDEGQKRC